MSLLDLQAPYQRLPLIAYYDHNFPQIKKRTVQHIIGSLYKSKEKCDTSQHHYCWLYIYFKEIHMGFLLESAWDIARMDPEQLHADMVERKLDTFEHFKEDACRRIADRVFFPAAQLLLLEIFAPDIAPDALRVRQEHRDKLNAEQHRVLDEARVRDTEIVRSTNTQAVKKVTELVDHIRNGNIIDAEEICFYRDGDIEKHSCINSFNLLADIYGIEIPINVRGWINRRHVQIEVSAGIFGRITRYSYRPGRGGNSKTFPNYMGEVVKKIKYIASEDSALDIWVGSLSGSLETDLAA